MKALGRKAGSFLLLALVALALVLASRDRGLVRIESATGTRNARTLLPEDTVLLDANNLMRLGAQDRVTPPFFLSKDIPVPGRFALMVSPAFTGPQTGSATFELQTLRPGIYWGWAYVCWPDSCGNSMGLRVDDGSETVIGQDSVFRTWHWVPAGKQELRQGEHTVVLTPRERSAQLAQLLFTPEKDFAPSGLITLLGGSLLRFGDDFARSPGHGSPAWDLSGGKWEIAFSLDPNRIPNQYSLVGNAEGGEAVALTKGPPWQGCRLSFSVLPEDGSSFGALLDRSGDGKQALRVGFAINAAKTEVNVEGPGVSAQAETAVQLRPDQWHRVDVERWAWMLRVAVDEQTVLRRCDLPLSGGGVGLLVDSGQAAFDDVEIVEMPWQAENGRELTIPWVTTNEAQWYRTTRKNAAEALIGRRGVMRVHVPKLGVSELMIDEPAEAKGRCVVSGLGLLTEIGSCRVFGAPDSTSELPSAAMLKVGEAEARIRRVAVCYGEKRADECSTWAYRFDEQQIPDPSDYLDFTAEEYRQIRESGDAEKLRRVPKYMPVVGRADASCCWVTEGGRWKVADGVLRGNGPNASLHHAQEILGEMALSLRFRALTADSTIEVELSRGARVLVAGGTSPAERNQIRLSPGQPGEWQLLRISARATDLEAQIGPRPPERIPLSPSASGRISLKVPSGVVEFDDIEFTVPRRSRDGRFYAFDRRETDWRRSGGQWIDHGGIACILASSWISLVAPAGEGMLWNKRSFGPDVVVAFDVEENTEWFGWDKPESHIHYPFDNIRVALGAEDDADSGYRLEVNAQGRTATVLYRQGKEVARVAQGRSFPIRYVGGHAPCWPRKNRIALFKRGNTLTASVNAAEVLRFSDPEPLNVSKVGIGGYKTHINFSHVEVRNLPSKPADAP